MTWRLGDGDLIQKTVDVTGECLPCCVCPFSYEVALLHVPIPGKQMGLTLEKQDLMSSRLTLLLQLSG